MNTGPLNENELEWLDDTLAKYAAEGAILDVSELDGLLTSNPLSGCWRFGAGRIMSRAGPTIASAIALSI